MNLRRRLSVVDEQCYHVRTQPIRRAENRYTKKPYALRINDTREDFILESCKNRQIRTVYKAFSERSFVDDDITHSRWP